MLPLIGPKAFETRGHCLKIQNRYCRTKLRANFFGFRIVNIWNGLPDDVVLAPTLNSFKGIIDRHWRRLRYFVFWLCHCLLMIWFNGSDLISPKANNGLLQPRLQDDDDDDDKRVFTIQQQMQSACCTFNRTSVISYSSNDIDKIIAHL